MKKFAIILLTFIDLLNIAEARQREHNPKPSEPYTNPPAQTMNVNEQTTLFEDKVLDVKKVESDLNEMWHTNKDKIFKFGEDFVNKKINEELDKLITFKKNGPSVSEIRKKLENISARDLYNEAIKIFDQEDKKYLKELNIDEKDPLMQQHKADVNSLSEAHDKVMGNALSAIQKQLGVDCRVVKGPKEEEPEYYMEAKSVRFMDTEYNETLCERLSNKYNCTKKLNMKCKKQGKKFGPWQDRVAKISGNDMYRQGGEGLGFAIKWKKKRWGWHLRYPNTEALHSRYVQFLSRYLAIPIDQIYVYVTLPIGRRGIGGTYPVYQRYRVVFVQYQIGYKYRETYMECAEWDEEWVETCVLNK